MILLSLYFQLNDAAITQERTGEVVFINFSILIVFSKNNAILDRHPAGENDAAYSPRGLWLEVTYLGATKRFHLETFQPCLGRLKVAPMADMIKESDVRTPISTI